MIYLGWSVSVILEDMKETGSPKLLFEKFKPVADDPS